jgi:DNA-binding transcriptional ArsR family regulator
MDKFRALGSDTRRKILKILSRGELHISGIAKELGISVPVAAKHIRILEKEGFIKRKKFGKTHVLVRNAKMVEGLLDIFAESSTVKIRSGSSILDVLKETSGVELKRVRDKEFVTSIDGEDGYYIYEVDGSFPSIPMDEFLLRNDAEIKLKKLIPIEKKRICVKVRK